MSTAGANGGVHLYLRVNDAITYDVSQGKDVEYVGMTEDGSKIYFTSEEQLTNTDTDTSRDLYMWSEATNALTLVSAGTGNSGNSDSCNSSWTSKCNIAPVTTEWTTDNSIAAMNGDIYFYSPQRLDGAAGVNGQMNLLRLSKWSRSVRNNLQPKCRCR